ncbi:MAG: succinylglutamate desuccinylase/aspartoacylase family protein [Candidatus Nanohaloarchaea archaeon]
MKVIEKGEDPEITVVGSVHGDEPAGKKAIEKVLERNSFTGPVRFIVANEEALEIGERYVEKDLNSSFPGDPDSEVHEERLAAEITDIVEDQKVLDIHSTKSHPEPFSNVKELTDEVREMTRAAGVENVVEFPEESGVLMEEADPGILVETGTQGTEQAAENAVEVIENFLRHFDVLPGEPELSDPDFYRYTETVKGDWEFHAENFSRVHVGKVYATYGGLQRRAAKEFYPVLMSTDGYEDKLGYKAEKIR